MSKTKQTKIVIVNEESGIYHNTNSPDGIKISVPNKDGGVGKYDTEENARKRARKSKKDK